MNTKTVYFGRSDTGHFEIQIDGLSTLMEFLGKANPDFRNAVKQGLREAASPILSRAHGKAMSIADDGTYSASLSIKTRANGNLVLQSTDPAAAVKEFAHAGAKTITSKGTPRANARLRNRSGVGVPRRADAPRVMVPSINESVPEVKSRIERYLERVLEAVNE